MCDCTSNLIIVYIPTLILVLNSMRIWHEAASFITGIAIFIHFKMLILGKFFFR